MSETQIRTLAWAITTVLAYFLVAAMTTWPTAGVVVAAILIGLFLCLIDVIILGAIHVFSEL